MNTWLRSCCMVVCRERERERGQARDRKKEFESQFRPSPLSLYLFFFYISSFSLSLSLLFFLSSVSLSRLPLSLSLHLLRGIFPRFMRNEIRTVSLSREREVGFRNSDIFNALKSARALFVRADVSQLDRHIDIVPSNVRKKERWADNLTFTSLWNHWTLINMSVDIKKVGVLLLKNHRDKWIIC